MIDSSFQKKVLACMVKVSSFGAVASQHIKASDFEGTLHKNVAKAILDYHQKYGSCITNHAFITIMKAEFKDDKDELIEHLKAFGEIKEIDVSDADFVLDQLLDFIKLSRWKGLIETAVEKHLSKDRKKPDIDGLEKGAMDILNISKVTSGGTYDYFSEENIRERAKARYDGLTINPGIGTGIPELDGKLNGRGWMAGELYLILAPAKMGKSQMLLWSSNAAVLRGKNVCHVTLEMSKQICSSRLDALNTGILFKDLPVRYEDCQNIMTKKASKLSTGGLKIIEYPTKSLTPSMLREELKKLERSGFKIDLLCVDYVDLLRSTMRDGSKWDMQADCVEQLRAIAGELQIPVLSASQINRSGKGKSLTDGGDIAGSFEKVAVADQIITLAQTDDERADSHLRIRLAEGRNAASGIIKIETAFESGRFYASTVGVDD